MERPKKRKTINKCWKEKEVASKNSGSHKKELQQRENKKKAKTIWKRDHRAKSNRKRKEKKMKWKSADYVVRTENSGSQVEKQKQKSTSEK